MFVAVNEVADFLDANHYLGRARRGVAWRDQYGVVVIGSPTSRNLPKDWLEISRWCLVGTTNGGSLQYAALRKHLNTTTVVSYSDPSAGHTGALYRACNFLWAPTWHRLREPPSGNGQWVTGEPQSVKDRWIDPISQDPRRAQILSVKDAAILRKMPWADWSEPFISKGKIRRGTGGADYSQFASFRTELAIGA